MSVARLSPGSSSEQPAVTARCTHSDAAARSAMSSASSVGGRRGSTTTSGRRSTSAISRRSTISPRRATVGQWMREAGAPSRYGRSESSSSSAACADSLLASLPSPLVTPLASMPSGSIRGSTSTSAGSEYIVREARPSGSRIVSRAPSSPRLPRRLKRTSTRIRFLALPCSGAAVRRGAARRARRRAGARVPCRARAGPGTGHSSSTVGGPGMRAMPAPCAAIPTHSHEPTPSSSSARPGTYSDGSSKPDAAALNSPPRRAAPSARVKARGPSPGRRGPRRRGHFRRRRRRAAGGG